MSISLKTHKMLWGRSGNRCAFPACRKILVEDETETDDKSIIGDEAHIVDRKSNGPRGKSDLTPKKRDKYDNLMLLCKNHHKLIDDQPNSYTVKVLHRMKQEHLDWVNQKLNPDIKKQKDEEIYATYIDEWIKLADINNWHAWTSFIFGAGRPKISVKQYEKLKMLNEYILSRVWPKLYPGIEFAFNNFRVILNDFLIIFSKYKEENCSKDPWYYTEKFYERLDRFDPKIYGKLVKKFEYHVDLVQDLMCELTRAGNYLCDQIRKYISSSFRISEGVLLITSGPSIHFSFDTYRLEYKSKDENDCKYPGLRKFMEIRKERGLYFGKGISENYFPIMF